MRPSEYTIFLIFYRNSTPQRQCGGKESSKGFVKGNCLRCQLPAASHVTHIERASLPLNLFSSVRNFWFD
jgi:hypothetical protein